MIAAFLALLLGLPVRDCRPSLHPLPVLHEQAPIHGVPVLFDGAAVSLHCKF